jgi:hypothetical protein
MTARKAIELGLRTVALAVGLTIIFMIGAMVSGMGQPAPTTIGAAPAAAAGQPTNALMLLFVASLVQALVVAYLVLEARGSGRQIAGALFLLFLNMWIQGGIEAVPYLRGQTTPNLSKQMLIMGVVTALLSAPFAAWVLGVFGRTGEAVDRERVHRPAAWWSVTLTRTTAAFVVLYYLCGYFIAWQNPAVREFYSGSTALRGFWGQMVWIWFSSPWMFLVQAGRGLLFVAMTLPAVWMLRGGARRVAFGTALMYAAWDGSLGLLVPNPIMPATVAHTHLVELVVWGLLFGAFVGWSVGRNAAAAPHEWQLPNAA